MALIAVLDDQSSNRTIYARLARSIRDGTVVESFNDPHATLSWVESHAPDLIITDYKMPSMDGAEFTRCLRALPNGREVPVMVITAYGEREFRLRALEAGATDFLQSPVDFQEFVTRGRNLLNLGQQQKLLRFRADDLERELHASEQSRVTVIRENRVRLLQVIDTIPALISAVDEHGQQVFINRYGADLLPTAGPDAVAQDKDLEVLRTGLALLPYEEDMLDRHGQVRTVLTSKFPLLDAGGAVRNVLTTSFDISERKRDECVLHDLAHHDTLTGLPNRLLLNTVLTAELAASAVSGRKFALHFIDLDRFKNVNDGFGHHQGDCLLQVIAGRLLQSVRPGDAVARLGGDEFAIVQLDVAGPGHAQQLADRLIASITEPIQLEQHKVIVGASIGVTLAHDDAATAEQLLKNADLAMYRAKREGRGRVRFFAAEMQTSARASALLEIDLRRAVSRGEFEMHYQPQVDVRSRKLIGAEALIRWKRPGHGVVAPRDFMDLAEDTGLVVPINRWVLHEVCRQGAAWTTAGTPLRLGVNLSSSTFKAENVVDLIVSTLDATGYNPALLELELTEGTLMENQREVARHLHALRQLGVRVAIDDFGTGYSSLAYLQVLPIDRLKIDLSFIRNLDSNTNGLPVVEAVVGIGRSLDMEVLAEGVETARQLNLVTLAGCQSAQGFHFGRAVPADQFTAFLQSGATLAPWAQPDPVPALAPVGSPFPQEAH